MSSDAALVRQAIGWMVRMQSGLADARVQRACEKWRQAHPANEKAWQRAQQVSRDLQQSFITLPQGSASLALDALKAANDRVSRRRALAQLSVVLGVAAPAAWLAFEIAPWHSLMADYGTATGERMSTTLADGTQLSLNTNSAVQLRFDEGQRLLVLLRGEIALATGKDAGSARHRPLRVQSRDGLLEALGTRFTVLLEAKATRLAVEQGAVAMYSRKVAAGSSPTVATAGSSYAMTEDAALPMDNRGLDAAGWTDGVLATRNMRLDDFLAEVARYRSGHLGCDAGVAALRLSGVYRLDDTEQLLALLPQVLPVRIEYRTRYWVRVVAR